ncbi:ankyrin repeat and sterile alpha motif domain-containing protein 1B-like isoform X2 [Chrysoperla carnea]|uniref:ankyrin repeat and sterile alpha motif domain-containing protein 1B-like isoform X2 n=1 Tax=Chrysoperla carnea TaxID=189513 RepID=UPI001D05DB40|nr:ankyrin repeat and sterile alpha motif domain-containing protein 1B-like isoform X2 [Chrysoperla carnea]
MGKDQELLEAARNGNIAVVEKILGQKAKRSGPLASLRRGPGANVQDSSGYSSLHHAALNGHREIVRLLLAHEASTNIVDVKGSSPLHLAAWTGNVDVVRLLLCHGPSVPNVNLTTKDNETALHSAAQYGHAAVVAQLLEHGCDPSIRNSRQETALDLAAQYGRLETVELLIRTHPELIEPMRRAYSSISFSHTPLHLASRNGHKSVVEVLLSAGVDVNIRTSAGTALHEAALCGKVEVVRTLLDHGVDLNIKDKQDNTVMDLLNQFPAHVTQETVNLIKRYRGSHVMDCSDMDPDRESLSQSLPPIPVPDSTLGSPYENVRPSSRGRTRTASPNSTSPSRWDFYRQSKSVDDAIDDRRKSGASALSLSSDNSYYQNSPAPKSFMDPCFHSSEEYPSSMYRQRDSDQISISSTASSTGGMTSSRDRDHRQADNSSNNIYLPMGPRSSAHSPGSNNKVSPTPPKKPPRRNLSVSPTHLTPMSMSADSTNAINNHAYEYLFLARSGARSQGDLEEIGSRTLQHGRSVDTYVEMNKRFSIAPQDHTLLQRGRSEELVLDDYNKDVAPSTPVTNNNQRLQPVAITAVYENVAIKTQNPRRKLRRHHDVYENFELRHNDPVKNTSSTPNITENVRLSTFVSNAYIMLKSSEESLIDDHRNSGEGHTHQGSPHHTKQLKRVTQLQQQQQQTPTSPTHYKQPPTPDHPPPTPMQAENTIHDRIRPLSQREVIGPPFLFYFYYFYYAFKKN